MNADGLPPSSAMQLHANRHFDGTLSPAKRRFRDRPGRGDLFAVSACVIAAALRMAFDSALPPGFPYLTFFPAVVVTTYLFGLRPGIVCAVLSGLVAWYCFIPPAHTFVLTWHIVVALGFYAFVVALDIALINGLRRTTDHLFSSMATVETLHASLEMQVGQRTRNSNVRQRSRVLSWITPVMPSSRRMDWE